MSPRHYIACDLGAESGRVMLGTLSDDKLSLEEVHRFPNGAVLVNGTLRWDVLRLFDELKTGLRKVVARGLNIQSLSTDSWGVDYVWLKKGEPFLTVPFHYRDARTYGYKKCFKRVPMWEVYTETGSQFIHINTVYQLEADRDERPWVFAEADGFLLVADYFNYLFSGVAKAERSIASTSQIYNPRKREWSKRLIKLFGFRPDVFPKIVKSGTVLGPLQPALAAEVGMKRIKVIASCSHDTAAAVAAVPAEGKDWAYLSSGTWSLLGIESAKPIIDDKSRYYNFTNEIGYGNTTRFLKNISGMWVVQECRRQWIKEGREYSYAQIVTMAEAAAPLKSLINPTDDRFWKHDRMAEKIADYCRETGQPVPANDGEYARCIFESLALLYRRTLEQIVEVTERKIGVLHIVGGGSQNALLNQFSANATGCLVVAGPVEATAIGNVLIQALALGDLSSLAELRETVRRSFPITTYKPQDEAVWQQAYERFEKLLEKQK
jgi:rhamnulokinase